MTKREELARDVFLIMVPTIQAPSADEVSEYLELAAKFSVLAADKFIKELKK